MIFLTWYSFLKKYCAILPKYKTIFFVSGTIAAAIQNQVQQNICRTAANTAAVIEAAAHIRLLHLLVGETRGFQLLYQFLIFIIVGFHLCSGSGILESHSVVAGTRMCYSRNIVPLGISVADAFQYADSFGKSAVANEVYGSLQVNAVLVAGSRRGVPVVEVAISAGVLVLAFVHDRLVCSALICFVELDKLPAWMVIIIIAREFIISGFRLVASDNGIVIAASWWGKSKTISQMIMTILLIADIPALSVLNTVLIWVALILTVVSLIDYLVKNKNVLSMQN